MVDFNQLMAKKLDEVETPKPLPSGTYRGIIISHELLESSEKKTPFVRFWIRPTEAQEDVDQDELAKYGPEKMAKVKMKQDFYLTEDAFFRLKKFLKDTLKLNCEGRSFSEVVSETTNVEVLIAVKQSLAKDGETIFSEIGSLAAAA